MSSHMPPVPPAARSDKGPGSNPKEPVGAIKDEQSPRNLAKQGRQGNIKQNTTHQGYQQDR